jgi:pyruvate dehydrogenase E2 component (dihydrolipoamide acetyltransferase)
MAISVVMPALEMAQETGKLISWLKKEGDSVVKGEALLEVETDKAVMEIEASGDGILAGVKAQAGDVVPVGQTIAWLVVPGEAVPTEVEATQSGRHMSAEFTPAAAASVGAVVEQVQQRRKASPKVRRLAKEHDIDLRRVKASGKDGEILTSDILSLTLTPIETVPAQSAVSPPASPASAPAVAQFETLSSTARLMAERTTKSWTTVPHFFLVREIDAGALLTVREKYLPGFEITRGVRLTHTDLLVALVARALAKNPRMNATWVDNQIRLNNEVNIGIAMAVEDAVVSTVIQNADKIDLAEIAVRRRDLAERAKAGRLRSADLARATFTISNLGMYNVDAFSAIITPPQAAILAVGRIADRVVPVDGKPGIRPMMTLTLSSDHRVADGARAAAFLNDLAEAIQAPEAWLRT